MYLMEQNISAYLDRYQLLYFLHLFEHVQWIPAFPVLPMTVSYNKTATCLQCRTVSEETNYACDPGQRTDMPTNAEFVDVHDRLCKMVRLTYTYLVGV